MTSPSAQKAAGEVLEMLNDPSFVEAVDSEEEEAASVASIIQQAITEAVDAAVAPKDKRVKELEAACLAAKAECARCDDGKVKRYYSNCGAYDMVACPCCGKARAALEAPHEP